MRTTTYCVGGQPYRITARPCLHYIRGTSAPYFSLTADTWRHERGAWREDRGGCLHDLILQHWPDLAPMVALSLSDIDGAPMYALENGYYWLAGCVELGAEYHGGSGTPARSPEECGRMLRDHLRITDAEFAALLADVLAARYAVIDLPMTAWREPTRNVLAALIEQLRPRWKAEADAAIERFSLTVTGDRWPTATA